MTWAHGIRPLGTLADGVTIGTHRYVEDRLHMLMIGDGKVRLAGPRGPEMAAILRCLTEIAHRVDGSVTFDSRFTAAMHRPARRPTWKLVNDASTH